MRNHDDLRREMRVADVRYTVVGLHMGYELSEFSRTLSGYRKPKGGISDDEFRAQVRRAIAEISPITAHG